MSLQSLIRYNNINGWTKKKQSSDTNVVSVDFLYLIYLIGYRDPSCFWSYLLEISKTYLLKFIYYAIITLLPFFIEMLQYDWLWSGHMIIKEMYYIPIKFKPEFALASMTTSDVNNQWCSNFQQQINFILDKMRSPSVFCWYKIYAFNIILCRML